MATVADRLHDEDAGPFVVELFWANEHDAVVDPSLELIMLEPKTQYFESIQHTMTGLQHAAAFE